MPSIGSVCRFQRMHSGAKVHCTSDPAQIRLPCISAEGPFLWETMLGARTARLKGSCYVAAPREAGLEDSNAAYQPVSTDAAP